MKPLGTLERGKLTAKRVDDHSNGQSLHESGVIQISAVSAEESHRTGASNMILPIYLLPVLLGAHAVLVDV